MKNLRTTAFLLFFSAGLFSCSNPSPNNPTPTACATVNSSFNSFYTTTLGSNSTYTDVTTMDLLTHEYTFSVAANQVICSVGYQGNANLFTNNIPYSIEIYDNTNSALLYSGLHVFNSTATDYQNITPVNLVAGNSYTIKRIVTNYLGNIANSTGRMVRFNGASPYPITANGLTITGSNFYGTGGPAFDFGLPYIEIIFQ